MTAPQSGPAASSRAGIPVVPGYDILAELGRGGMGVVYKARQAKLGRVVALKMILSGAHAGADDLARFRTEAEAIARLEHPNIVQIHEVGEHDGLPYFSLEFCGGGSLEKKLHGAPLPPKEAAALVETLARAMHAAHLEQVIHRDLKPANVLLTRDGTPKITDFGLAKKLDQKGPTATGAMMGTPSYMAPEQAGGKRVGLSADVYALGAILYECLTGRPPFQAATPLDTVLQVVSDEPVSVRQLNDKVPVDLETICHKCLEKDPSQRYASALELAKDLERYLTDDPVSARPLGEWESARRWARKHPITATLTVLAVTGVLFWMALMAVLLPLVKPVAKSVGEVLFFSGYLAGVASFLATMAVLVRPRRRVAVGGVLLFLLVVSLPWLVGLGLGGAGSPVPFERTEGILLNLLGIPLGLTAGLILAALFGGTSRWLARRHQSDMLTVFFGGGCGAVVMISLCNCGVVIPILLFGMLADRGVSGNWPGFEESVMVAQSAAGIVGSLTGFWLGGTLVARFTRRHLKSE
jgi:tRNA A-37 threonylcarbamoyl transferase component Bud32